MRELVTPFVKGHTPWNKGLAGGICKTEGCTKRCHCKGYCRKHYDSLRNNGTPTYQQPKYVTSEETKEKIRLTKLESKNPMWKGDEVGYTAIHNWIKSRLPKPDICQRCEKTKPLDLANKSNQYLRDISDWEYLCRDCHMETDGRKDRLIARNKTTQIVERDEKGRILLSVCGGLCDCSDI